ncbi:glycosyltransferase family 4 protein [Heyndrickxia sp. NPDC080065]|uniref:glycosyltransferase family 4 protein n=1 Tax=Heyndrickxia sp. NPDC080065 TaxID=3390568 RepID=UPI003D081E95
MGNKKVIIISQNFYPEIGSAANRMKNLFQLLKIQGYEVTVLTTEPSYPYKKIYDQERFWNNDEMNTDDSIHRVMIKNRKYAISMLNRLLYYLEMAFKMLFYILKDKKKYDFVLVTSPPIFVGMVGLIAKIRYKSSLLLDIRDLWPESLKGVGILDNPLIFFIFNRIEQLLYKKADFIIVNSKGFEKHIQKRGKTPQDKIVFLPNAARQFEIKPFMSKKEFKVVYAGNLGLAQDVELIKNLARKLKEHQIKLTIIGYGMKKNSLMEFVKTEKLNNVKFINPVTREKCLHIISEHSVGVVTLKDKEVFETVLPGKVIDYMTCMVPVVASVSGFTKQVIETENVGLVSTSKSVDEMVQQILFLKDQESVRKEMEINCKQYIQSNFTWEKNIPLLTNVMESNSQIQKAIYDIQEAKIKKL